MKFFSDSNSYLHMGSTVSVHTISQINYIIFFILKVCDEVIQITEWQVTKLSLILQFMVERLPSHNAFWSINYETVFRYNCITACFDLIN